MARHAHPIHLSPAVLLCWRGGGGVEVRVSKDPLGLLLHGAIASLRQP